MNQAYDYKRLSRMVFSKSGGRTEVFGQVQNTQISLWRATLARTYLPEKFVGGV